MKDEFGPKRHCRPSRVTVHQPGWLYPLGVGALVVVVVLLLTGKNLAQLTGSKVNSGSSESSRLESTSYPDTIEVKKFQPISVPDYKPIEVPTTTIKPTTTDRPSDNVSVPPATKNVSRPATKLIKQDWAEGRGSITLINESSRDAAVKVLDTSTGRRIALVYLRTGAQFKLAEVVDGTYAVYALFGSDWLGEPEYFKAKQSAIRDENAVTLRTTSTEDEQGVHTKWVDSTLTIVERVGIGEDSISIEDFIHK
ncbi:MAG: hypothetical protein CBB60_006365 [Armatimonadetes bacterium Cent15-Ar3]|nr:MAG: hypothetical protein CBB60_006365 [Armatimonadetes bacterium Cent15-Ar3]